MWIAGTTKPVEHVGTLYGASDVARGARGHGDAPDVCHELIIVVVAAVPAREKPKGTTLMGRQARERQILLRELSPLEHVVQPGDARRLGRDARDYPAHVVKVRRPARLHLAVMGPLGDSPGLLAREAGGLTPIAIGPGGAGGARGRRAVPPADLRMGFRGLWDLVLHPWSLAARRAARICRGG